MKIALGLAFLALGYVFMVWAGVIAADGVTRRRCSSSIATYFWHTVGELCLSPTGLVVRDQGGAGALGVAADGHLVRVVVHRQPGAAALVAAQVEAIEQGTITLPWHLGGQADFFLLFVVAAGAAAVLILVLAPLLDRLAGDRA